MSSDETSNVQQTQEVVNFFSLKFREYLPKEKCTPTTWNNDIRIKLQYEFTNILAILFLSKDRNQTANLQVKLQKITFELLSAALHHGDVNLTSSIEFLENCSIVSYLKICKVLGYDFVGKDDLDIDEISGIEIKDEFKHFLLDSSENSSEKLPSFTKFIEEFITPFIMDGAWFIQMNYNENSQNTKWVEFVTRLCRGNITSKERPLPSIPKSVKLINIKDIVFYLDLGKTDSMGITDSLISQNYRLQQKYVRERTRLCFTVDSFVTHRECLKGFSILAMLIKIYFDQYNELDLCYLVNENNSHNTQNKMVFNGLDFIPKYKNSEINRPYSKFEIDSIWNVILRYDLSIQRSIGIIFEVFISFCSNICDFKGNSCKLFSGKLFILLREILNTFPKKIVTKTYLIFIEYASEIYNLLRKSSIINGDKTEVTVGNDKYNHNPWLINSTNEISDIFNVSFFVLSSLLIKMDYIDFSLHLKHKLIQLDELFWNYFSFNDKSGEEIDNNETQVIEITSELIPSTTLINIKKIYQYYHLVFNAQFGNVGSIENNYSSIELVIKNILKYEGVSNSDISLSNILFVLSDLLKLPSILFANACFITNIKQDNVLHSKFNFSKQISKDFEFLREITDRTSLPICIFKISNLIIKEKLIEIFNELKSHITNFEYCFDDYLLIYNEFCSLMDWIEKYCSYYLFKENPDIIPTIFEIMIIFIANNSKYTDYIKEKSNYQISLLKTPKDLLLDASINILFPAISFLPITPLIPEMLKNSLFDKLELRDRYKIYRNLITKGYNRYPMNYKWVCIKKSLSKHLKGVTTDILTSKTCMDNSNNMLNKPPIQIRLLVSNIVSLCYTNPLVVCDVVINQCNIYDNMIPLLIEILGENIDEVTFDMMIFTIINFMLSRESLNINSQINNKDINNLKLGPGGIARFLALLFTKRDVPRDVIHNFIKTVIYRIDEALEGVESKNIIQTSIFDIVFWRQFVEIVLSTPVIDISVLTKRQLESLAGGPVLFHSSLSNNESSMGFNQECEYTTSCIKSFKQTNDTVVSMLRESEIETKEILFRLAMLKSEILWNTLKDSIIDLKFLVNLSDEIHWCCIQTIEFLKRSFSSETYRDSVLEIRSEKNFSSAVYQTFLYLDIPTGWSFIRPGMRSKYKKIENGKSSEMINDNLFDIHPLFLNGIKDYILSENDDDTFLKDEVWIYFYISFWYLDISDIFVPREEYSKKLFELYNNIYDYNKAIMKEINPNFKDIDNQTGKYPLDLFLDPDEILRLPSHLEQKNLKLRQIKDKVYEKKLLDTYSSLSKEFYDISKRNEDIFNYLNSEMGILRFKRKFKENIFNSECSQSNVNSFMVWICKVLIAPRVVHSESDAIFTFKWIEIFLLSPRNGIFSSDMELVKSFLLILCKLVSSIIRSSTPRESQLLGLFFNYIFSFCRTHFETEFNEDKKEKIEIESNNCKEIGDNNPKEFVKIEENNNVNKSSDKPSIREKDQQYLNFIIECERNVLLSLSLGLGLLTESPIDIVPDWIETLNCIWMLLRCYESFPISKLSGEYLLHILPKILDYATKKQWNDLKLSITSLMLKLKQQKKSWIGSDNEFQFIPYKEKIQLKEKVYNDLPEKDKYDPSSNKTVDNRPTATLNINNTKRQRTTSSHSYRSGHSYSKIGIHRR